MLKVQRCVGLAAAALGLMGAAMGCGDDEAPPSYGSIAKGIESPTGTVDANTASDIGKKYEAANQNNVGFGVRDQDQVGQSGSFEDSQSCPAGGNYRASGSGNQSSGSVNIDYNACCFSAGCCASGDGTIHFNSEGGGSGAQSYTFCATFDMTYSCEGSNASLDYSLCYGAGGEAVLLIEVDGRSFAVSASRTGASGSLEIRGANGTWTCTYNAGSGSCTSSAGGSFTYSAD